MADIKTVRVVGLIHPKMMAYTCDRCLCNYSVEDKGDMETVDESKETFDYKAITGYLMCPSCRDEFDHLMSKAWKAKATIKYGDYHNDIQDIQEDRFEKREEAVAFLDEAQKKILEYISQGYVVKELRTELSYVPYADRRE